MTTYTPEQIKMVADMIDMCTDRLERVAEAKKALNGMFYLVIQDGTMVVERTEGNIFRLTVGDAASGHGFTQFMAAKRAANRWNRNLTKEQARCTVHPVSHAQYLEHIEEMTGGVLRSMYEAQALIDQEATPHGPN